MAAIHFIVYLEPAAEQHRFIALKFQMNDIAAKARRMLITDINTVHNTHLDIHTSAYQSNVKYKCICSITL